ncbi:MAG TPA: DNA mismatch repair protein MutS [Bacillota bacterium]|nr:DNA mismatch repair protein MutS [Bacillota bacterium]HOK67910.1 DNA mismatch repair protein MutS [Bacillota bacterium]HPP84301.1 DNA mismatch repair protein MutS [Bacillota bacterium]
MALSPMMQQYFKIKEKHPDCILMFRVGDFYEMFYEDAKTVSRELELVLTGKDCGDDERAPMCGVPFHAVESYLTKLVSKGYRVAICEQLEDPALAKGLVKRDVIRIVSPGTVTEGGFLRENENNYICSLYYENGNIGAAFADISTGEINATEIFGEESVERLFSEAAAFSPSEVITDSDTPSEITKRFSDRFGSMLTVVEKEDFLPENAKAQVSEQFGADWETKFETTISSYAALAVGALLAYIKRTQKTDISYLRNLTFYDSGAYLGIDAFSRRNLELTSSLRSGEKKGSLLWVLDKTKTALGARLLRKWIDKPLINCNAIKMRQDAVKELYNDSITREEITRLLRDVVDIERLCTRLVYGSANARDLKALEATIKLLPAIREKLAVFKSPLLKEIAEKLDTLDDIGESIGNTIADDPPVSLREGGIIKPGCNATVDELRSMMTDGKTWISKIEATEKERTGIRTLKVGYNKVFGYYIEVSKSFIGQVPPTYIRRQTLTNCERYVTEELKDIENRVIGAKDRVCALEYELFCALRDYILKALPRIQGTASAVANLDVIAALASVAREYNYVCPEVDYSDKIVLKDSRHPVVERFLNGSYFVPNDCHLDCAHSKLMLITGPNMAGKSTYMRQVALCVLMAQIGSFVPAAEARIGVVDRIFTRVGASDDLASGSSTFMIEMNEVAEILKNATKKSLIIYDEIGRGTSTYDGMSIARAVVEYTCKKIGAKTLFATHYHELTELENEIPGVINYNIAAKKRGDDIIFLRKIVKGAADDSYGIEVAMLAGVPSAVVTRAKQILASLEAGAVKTAKPKKEEDNITFEDIAEESIKDKLRSIDLNTITPLEALSLLFELKKLAE